MSEYHIQKEKIESVRNTLLGAKSLLKDSGELKKKAEQQAQAFEGFFSFASLHKHFRDYAFLRHVVESKEWDSFPNIFKIRDRIYNSNCILIKNIRLSEARKGVSTLLEDVEELLSLFTSNDLLEGLEFAYRRYCNIIDRIIEMEKSKVQEVSVVLGKNKSDYYYIPLGLYENVKRDKNGEKLIENFSDFVSSHKLQLRIGEKYLYFMPITEEDVFLNGWFRLRNKRYNIYITESPVYKNNVLLSLKVNTSLDGAGFKELLSNKTDDEIEKYLRDTEQYSIELEKVYDETIAGARRFINNKQQCFDEFKRIWTSIEERPRQIVIEKNNGNMKLEEKFANTIYVSGYTFAYSDYEGCTSHISFKGDIKVVLDVNNNVVCFEDINLSIDSEYDGWDEEEFEENVLEKLREEVKFSLV